MEQKGEEGGGEQEGRVSKKRGVIKVVVKKKEKQDCGVCAREEEEEGKSPKGLFFSFVCVLEEREWRSTGGSFVRGYGKCSKREAVR